MSHPAPSPSRPHSIEYRRGSIAVLLIHGLTGTPAEMRRVARGLAADGFSVFCVQLAGHCGSERDLTATTWTNWLDSSLAAFDRLRGEYERVFVGGLSMGGLLALHVAARRPADVAGCLVYSATMFYDGWSIPRFAFLMHIGIRLGLGRFVRFRENFPSGVKDERLRRRLAAAMEAGDSAGAGLLHMPGVSLGELLKLISDLKRRLPAIRTPTLVLHAREDDITSIRNAGYLAAHLGGRVEKILLDDCYHMITLDQHNERVIAYSAEFMRRIAGDDVALDTLLPEDEPVGAPCS
jgi:carboxylesterase